MNSRKATTWSPIWILLLWNPALGGPSTTTATPEQPNFQERPPLVLGQGEQKLLQIPGLQRFSLGSPNIRALKLSSTRAPQPNHVGSLMIKAITPGFSDLWVWKQDGSTEHRSIRIVQLTRESIPEPLTRALSRLYEIDILIGAQNVILRGIITSWNELETLAAITAGFPETILDQTTIHSKILEIAYKRLKKWVTHSDQSHALRIEQIGSTLWLRGSAASPIEQNSLKKAAQSIFPLVQTDLDSFPDHSPTVYFRVYLMELKKRYFRTIGLNWPGTESFQVTQGLSDPVTLNFTLQNLEGNGYGTLLSNPELVVRAPGEAELFAGGELPIRSQSRFSSSVTWKPYGLTLKLHVAQVAGERIRLDIFTEVSHLDQTGALDQIPGIQANRMKTQVDARFGIPLLLSGLLQKGLREEIKGLPFLRNLPVLGRLFGSEDYMNEQSELVAVLYPRASPPLAPTEDFVSSKNPLPPPRNWTSTHEDQSLRNAYDYPWNALQ